jgi:hypothetical protein
VAFLLLRLATRILDFTIAVTIVSLMLGGFVQPILVASGLKSNFASWTIEGRGPFLSATRLLRRRQIQSRAPEAAISPRQERVRQHDRALQLTNAFITLGVPKATPTFAMNSVALSTPVPNATLAG